MKEVLITGGAGFIGANLSRSLLRSGHRVIAVDNLITSTRENVRELKKNRNFVFIHHDVVKPFSSSQLKALGNVAEIYHLACPTGVPNLTYLAEEMLLTCSMGTRNILELARKLNASFLLTSSSEVYGNPEIFPQTEEYSGNVNPVGVRSPYEEGKRFAESLVRMYVYKYAVDGKIVRIFNTYGPSMATQDTRVIPTFLRQVKSGKPLTVAGDGNQTRTFCFVDDLVDGLITVMQKGKTGEVYNLGSDAEVTITELAELIIRVVNAKKVRLDSVIRPVHDHERRLPSLKKIKALGWKSTVSLPDGLKNTYDWYLSM